MSSQEDEDRVARQQAILGLGKSYVSTQNLPNAATPNETTTLLPPAEAPEEEEIHYTRTRGIVWSVLTALFAVSVVILVWFPQVVPDALAPLVGRLPKDPLKAAVQILDRAPVIDGHIDLPILLRSRFANNLTAVDLRGPVIGHVDIPRLKQGKVGGFFWSVYVGCAKPEEEGPDFLTSTWRVRDTLEQIDVAKLAIEQYSDAFQLALGSQDIRDSLANRKIASLLGVEGGHQLGNSLATLRQYYELGVRYVTLTHTCHNAFADSCGMAPGFPPLHNGLSSFGLRLIDEMNRLGVLVDLSHTSDETAKQALQHSKAPVIWSHSSARAVHSVPRNVPDDVLALVGNGRHQTDAVIMINFAPQFVADDGKADIAAVADHVEHIARKTGKKHVGIGSDYDGIDSTPQGLEDVSKYPNLFAELYKRGWTQHELAGLAGGKPAAHP
ncbi:Dipeptidase [Mycena chlorophos]|uniref:Dipeptidase n=1 Tax=Mycena chlorophos TaxID=658473 RepID=A0A8H6W042_MYCCL|nr:Dipeptidase [Mycena chlorophos]